MALVIDPYTKTVRPWQPPPQTPFLEAVRSTLQTTQIDSMMVQKNLCAWCDNFGMLRSEQRFFRFKESPYRFAGTVIFTGVDQDGMPCDAGKQDLDAIAQNVDWEEGLKVDSIREELRVQPTEQGPWPRVIRITEFNREPQLPAGGPQEPYDVRPVQSPLEDPERLSGPARAAPAPVANGLDHLPEPEVYLKMLWTVVSDDEADKFVATEEEQETGRVTGHRREFTNMAEVAAHFSQLGAVRLDDASTLLPDEVVARFLAP